MPAKAHKITTDELYEAIRNSHGVTFEFVTGGVKYRAVLEHKENRYTKHIIIAQWKQSLTVLEGNVESLLLRPNNRQRIPLFSKEHANIPNRALMMMS
jgi:hypothetical protein